MKKQLLMMGMLALSGMSFAQTDRLWTRGSLKTPSPVFKNVADIDNPRIYKLDIHALKNILSKANQRTAGSKKSDILISFPNSKGEMEDFQVIENSNFDPELAAKYPDIKSYTGESIDKTSSVFFSISSLGLSSMEIYSDKSAVFIEPYTQDLSSYIVYKKSDRKDNLNTFECTVLESAQKGSAISATAKNANDATLRTFRLALSCTGEYAGYFGGTKAQALAAMNNTLTRVNGIFQNEFAARMVLIQMENWNFQLMNTLSSTIGNANFDIGHLFGRDGGGGNAGCIGCICSDDMSTYVYQGITYPNAYKGSGYTSPSNGIPSGDSFDIDFVAHEMGHQFGGNHTWSYTTQSGLKPVEPGSGSTIMGYAGITNFDVQKKSDPFFHALSIEQITNTIKANTCSVNTATGNSIPIADAGSDYTIPKSTPFMLTGSGADADGDPLTYIWEQMDKGSSTETGFSSAAVETKINGPLFRSWTPSTSPIRYFPRMSSVLAGQTITAGDEINVEALPSVARNLNFRFTVRDNKTGGAGNNSDDTRITVSGGAGPFIVTSQNTPVTYTGGSSQTVTWNVAGTTSNGINATNVDILWSTDSGNSWTTLVSGIPNNGMRAVTIPDVSTTSGRIMVKGSHHIFFNVNTADISVTPSDGKPITGDSGSGSSEINLYPNPVQDILTVTNITDSAYKIYDMSGRLVKEGTLQNGTVRVSDLANGIYLIHLDQFRKKFIKN